MPFASGELRGEEVLPLLQPKPRQPFLCRLAMVFPFPDGRQQHILKRGKLWEQTGCLVGKSDAGPAKRAAGFIGHRVQVLPVIINRPAVGRL